ncbi:hypothetical protein MMC11_004277 [Xylographa trunciseda]|nr:hypothetical protein [Xylographa trunciseda]
MVVDTNQDGRGGLSKRGWSNVAEIMPRISAAVTERTRQDNPNIDLATAENWLLRPEIIALCKDAIVQKLQARDLSYPRGFSGDPDLLASFARLLNTYFNPRVPVETAHIATAPGAASCLDTLLFNICDPGDGVLVPGPYWSKKFPKPIVVASCLRHLHYADGFDFMFKARSSVIPVLVTVPTLGHVLTNALIPALEDAYMSARCAVKALCLTNPHNPLGQCYPKDVIEGCLRFCKRHDIHFISDEVYALSSFPCVDVPHPVPFTSVLSLDVEGLGCDLSRVHMLWSTSKDFGQSGFRMGCSVTQANQEMAVGLALAANTQTSALASVFVTALLTSQELPSLIALNSQRLAGAYQTLTDFFNRYKIPYIPCYAGIYVFARIAPNAQSWEDEAIAVRKFKDEGVLVSASRGYHGPENDKGWARICFAVESSKLEKAIRRMERVYANNSKLRQL